MNILSQTKYENKKTICLNMIVKDESHIIQKTLKNLCEHFDFSYYVISDTGSKDNTIDLIKQFFRNKNIDGEIIENEWKNFEHNRNIALNISKKKADYSFVFDADDFIHGDVDSFILPNVLTADGYTFTFKGGGSSYHRTLLINNKKKWHYVGVVHEVLTCGDTFHNIEHINGDYYIESGRTGARNRDPLKYQKDALLLEEAINNPETDKSLIGRYAFYCGQSWKDFNDYKRAIQWYKKVVLEYNNWSEEKYYACLKIGEMFEYLKKTDKALFWYLLSNQFNSNRLEGITFAARILIQNKMYNYAEKCLYDSWKYSDLQYPLKDFLFATDNIYSYEYLSLIARASYYSKNYELCSKSILKLFERYEKLTINEISTELMNLQFYIPYFSEPNKYIISKYVIASIERVVKEKDCINAQRILQHCDKYFKNIIMSLLENNFNNIVEKIDGIKNALTLNLKKNKIKSKKYGYNIILTMTTCKRYDLFEKTMNSILFNWEDISNIDKFIIIDDNSSEEDKQSMIKNYPFIELFEKDEEQKGHRSSMNIIWNLLKTLRPKYWIHLEDDWLFFKKGSYVNKPINALETSELLEENIQQILYNKGYGELISDLCIPIGKKINNNIENNNIENNNILLHVQNQKLPVSSCSYWWHYSFRPSLIRTDAILELGNYDSDNTFFELDYAKKYVEAGYKSAYYNDITCLHIGRLSGVRADNDSSISNAYMLNNTEQFNSKKRLIDENKTQTKINISKLFDKEENIKYQDINNEFIFIQGFDIIDNDLFYENSESIEKMMECCKLNSSCIGFNTLGFFKNNITKLERSRYFKENDGVYIRKKYLNFDI